jgi:hypothetical protein
MFGGFTTTERNRAPSHERDEQQPRTNKCKRAGAVVRSKNKEVELDSADFLRDVIEHYSGIEYVLWKMAAQYVGLFPEMHGAAGVASARPSPPY